MAPDSDDIFGVLAKESNSAEARLIRNTLCGNVMGKWNHFGCYHPVRLLSSGYGIGNSLDLRRYIITLTFDDTKFFPSSSSREAAL
jgi:hypothetical protein